MDKESIKKQWRKDSANYRKRQKERGLCRHCPSPVYRNDVCKFHYEKYLETNRNNKRRRIEGKKCRTCSKPLIQEELGLKECFNCREKIRPINIDETIT